MGFGPIGHSGKAFEKMTFTEMDQYLTRANNILEKLRRKEYEMNDEELKYWLYEACDYGMLYSPDNTPASKQNVSKMLADPKTAPNLISDLILVKYDPKEKQNICRPINAIDGARVAVGRIDLTVDQVAEKQQAYYEKQHSAALRGKIVSLQGEDHTKYREDVNTLFNKLTAGDLEVGSPALTECIEAAIDLGIVRTVKGIVPAKKNAAEFAKRPAFLKSLVFAKQSESDSAVFESYRFNVSDSDPQTVKMDSAQKLTPANIAQMDKAVEALGSREKLPGKLADALQENNQAAIADYEKRLKEFGYKVELLDGMQAFSLKGEQQVYFYGKTKPITTPEDLVKAVRYADAPTPPNKWGFFEFLRKGWHAIFNNLPDYQEYEQEQGLYELDKYHLAEKAGLDVSGMTDKVKEYNEKYGHLYDAYRNRQEVNAWSRNFEKYPMNADEKAFINDFKAAMKQYPDIAAQIMKNAPNVSKDMLDELVFAAQPYAELSQAGDFDKKKLGVLSALGVAAECDLFSSELKEQIFGLCKDLNKDFGSAYGAEFLTDAQEKSMTSGVHEEEQKAQVDMWARGFEKHPMNADEQAFVADFKAAMKQYPDIAAQIMKDAPNVSKDMLNELVFAAQPYAELSQAGDFDKKKLGVLSALGVAAECDLFSSELKEQIFGLCKTLNKDFGSAYGAEFLTDAQEKQAMAEVAPDEAKPEKVVVGGGNANKVIDLDDEELDEELDEEIIDNKEQKEPLDLDDVQPEEENPLVEEENTEPRPMTEKEKRVIAEEYNDLSEGEQRQVQRLMEQHGFKNYDVFNLNNANSEIAAPDVNENANTEPQIGNV